MGFLDFLNRKTTLSEIEREVATLEKERNQTLNSDDLTPKVLDGKERRYHYKDINIYVSWQFGGRYGKDCKSIGMKRGDELQLKLINNDPEDPEAVGVYWNHQRIGSMKSNRLRGMVRDWKAAKLPILAAASHVGGKQKLLLELAFYGAPQSKKKSPASVVTTDKG